MTGDSSAMLDAPRRLASFRRALSQWYRQHARPLPWRATRDPYHIWISEIMLQQTTVVAVVPYFERFLDKFPTLARLAGAKEQEVLRLWEGLGYYSRARNIHRAAQQLLAEFDGQFPQDVATLLELPGIGRYTAGAIASFAFDVPAPIVEANTLRLYSRLLGLRDDPRSSVRQKQLWEFAEQIVPRQNPGEFNQALMELGAKVCTPKEPDCPSCPVKRWCEAAANNWQAEIPLPAKRVEPTAVTEIAVALERQGKYLLIRRQPGERWAGLWEFVRFGWNESKPPTPQGIGAKLADQYGLRAMSTKKLTEIRHSVTRFKITLHCFSAEWKQGELDAAEHEFFWVAQNQLPRYPLSVTGRKLAKLISNSE